MNKTLQKVVEYCTENVSDFTERVEMALGKIDHWRCPLEQADHQLFEDICQAIEDCSIEYDIDCDNICVEDVIWA